MLALRLLRRAVPVLFTSLVVSACGGDDADDDSAARQQFASDVCEALRPCCQQAGAGNGGALTLCKAAYTTYGRFDQAAAAKCLEMTRASVATGAYCTAKGDPATTEACSAVFPDRQPGEPQGGTKPPGSACQFSSECAAVAGAKVYCTGGSGGSGNTCVALTEGKQGDVCGATVDGGLTLFVGKGTVYCDTAKGLYCEDTCVARVGLGASCTQSFGCQDGLQCKAGKCAPPTAKGGACVGSSECADGTFCGDKSNVCESVKPDGEACGTNDECASSYCDGTCKQGVNPGLLFLCSG